MILDLFPEYKTPFSLEEEEEEKEMILDLFPDLHPATTELPEKVELPEPEEKAPSLGKQVLSLPKIAYRGVGKGAGDIATGVKSFVEKVYPKATGIKKALDAFKEAYPEPLEGIKKPGMLQQAVGGVTEFVPAMALSAVGGPAGITVGTITTFATLMGSSYDQYKEAGVDNERSFNSAFYNALAQTPLEMLGNVLFVIKPLKNLVKTFGIAGNASKRIVAFGEAIAKGIVGEGLEEYFQQYPDEIANYYAANPDVKPEDLANYTLTHLKEIHKKGIEAAKVGAVGGGLLVGGLGAIQAPFSIADYRRETEQKGEQWDLAARNFLDTFEAQLDADPNLINEIPAIRDNLPGKYLAEFDNILEEYRQKTASNAAMAGLGDQRAVEVAKLLQFEQIAARMMIGQKEAEKPKVEAGIVQDLAARALMGEDITAELKKLPKEQKDQIQALIPAEEKKVEPVAKIAPAEEKISPRITELAGKAVIGQDISAERKALNKTEQSQLDRLIREEVMPAGWEDLFKGAIIPKQPAKAPVIPKAAPVPGLGQLIKQETLTDEDTQRLIDRRGKAGPIWNKRIDEKLKTIGKLPVEEAITPAPLRPEAIEEVSAAPIRPPNERWETDSGSMPGEPFMFLDGKVADEAKAALIERVDEQNNVLYEAATNEGQSLGIFPTVEEAVTAAEGRFPKGKKAEPGIPKKPTAEFIGYQENPEGESIPFYKVKGSDKIPENENATREALEKARIEVPETPPVKEAPKKPQKAPEKVKPEDRATTPLEKIKVNRKAIHAQTGEEISIKQDAKTALAEIENQRTIYRNILECVSA